MAVNPARLARECENAAERARSLRIRDFRWSLSGDAVTLEGEALTPEAVDSAVKLFALTLVREVVNRIRVTPPDPNRPGAVYSPAGYVHVVELGPHASRLVETQVWEVGPEDTLASIAQATYGDAGGAERIAQANAGQIGANGFVRVGQKLRIPPR